MVIIKISNTQQRLLYLISERGIRQKDIIDAVQPLCQKYDVKFNKSDISQYLSGKSEPYQDKLFILSEALSVNVGWLMGFDVPMNDESPTIDEKNNWDVIHNAESLSAELVLQEQIQSQYGQQVLNLVNDYRKLDDVDRGKIDERVDILLDQDKYSVKKESRHA